MVNKIEQIIGDMDEYIDGCKLQPFSNTKIVVDKPQMETYLAELRQYTPEEIRKYERMLNNRDKIIEDAQAKANEIENAAKEQAESMVSETVVIQKAYEKANEILTAAQNQAEEILNTATGEAEQIRSGALTYTNEMLNTVESIISGTIDDANNRYKMLMTTLNDHLNIVQQNQAELNGTEEETSETEPEVAEPIHRPETFDLGDDFDDDEE